MQYALALPARLAVDPRSAAVGVALHVRVLGRLVDWWMRILRVDFEKLRKAEDAVGTKLLDANTAEDVAVLLDEPDPFVRSAQGELLKIGASPVAARVVRLLVDLGPSPSVLGPIVAARLRVGMVYLRELARLATTTPTESVGRDMSGDPLLDLASRVDVPVEIAEAALQARRAGVAVFGLGYAVGHRDVPAWLANALATAFADGARASLRLVALDPAFRVDERILPPHERFDVAAIEARHKAELAYYEGLPVQEAVAQGAEPPRALSAEG